jgi:hypothetical protein
MNDTLSIWDGVQILLAISTFIHLCIHNTKSLLAAGRWKGEFEWCLEIALEVITSCRQPLP